MSIHTDVILTCALTGDGDTVGKNPHVPVTPLQIAQAGIEAARAGASAVHIHVRDPVTTQGSRDVALYREVVNRIRESGMDIVLNLTAGMGGKYVLDPRDYLRATSESDMAGPLDRLAHVIELRPEICSLDCGSFATERDRELYVSTPDFLRVMAEKVAEIDVKPELECFDLGHVQLANRLVAEGLITGRPFYQLALGVNYCAPADTTALLAMRSILPAGAHWAAFGVGRMQMPMVAQSMILGGHVRVGLEDNLYLSRGVPGSNAQLVEQARRIVHDLGGRILTPAETRDYLGLKKSV